MLYFADRSDEVPVGCLIKTKHLSNGGIPCVINLLVVQTDPTRPSHESDFKNNVYNYIRFS